jgi:hypothetical protein
MRDSIGALGKSIILAALLAGCQSSPATPAIRAPDAAAERPQSKPAAPLELYVWNGAPGTGRIGTHRKAQLSTYAIGSSGNTAPSAHIAFGAPVLSTLGRGEFWAGPFNSDADPLKTWVGRYASSGGVLQTLTPVANYAMLGAALDAKGNVYAVEGETGTSISEACVSNHIAVFEYKAGVSSNVPTHLFNVNVFYETCNLPIVVDANGNIFLGLSRDAQGSGIGEIYEFSANAAGAAKLRRKIMLPPTDPLLPDDIGGLAVDASGNLFALDNNTLLKYVAGSGSPQPVLPGLYLTAFALDASGTIYAAVQLTPPTQPGRARFAIEAFAPGSTTPLRTISGDNARLEKPTGIAVGR